MATSRFYGWTIAVTLWFTYLLSVGLPFYGASVVNAAMGQSLQLDKTTIGLGFSMLNLVWGFSGPVVAWMLNSIGMRKTIVIGSLIIAAGALSLAFFVHDGWTYVFGFGGVVGLGIGLASNIPTQTGIAFWFNKKRALVISLVMTSSGVGGFFAPPLLNRIIAAADWHAAWILIVVASVISAVIAAIFLRDKPADIGQWPDGIAPTSDEPSAAHAGKHWTPREVLRRPVFWQILIAGTVFAAPVPLLVAHGINHLEGLGHPASIAAWALGLMLLFSVPGRILAGILCDRFAPRYVWAGMMALVAGGVVIVTNAATQTEIALFAVLMGVGYGGSIICWVAITARYFGPTSFATVMGMQTPFTTLVVASVPTAAGMLYDKVGNYSLAFWILSGAVLFGTFLIMGARAPKVIATPLPAAA